MDSGPYLYPDDSLPESEEPPPLQHRPEPPLHRHDAGHDLLMQSVVQLKLLTLPHEDLAAAHLVVVSVQVQRQQEVLDVVLRTDQQAIWFSMDKIVSV